MGPRRPDNSARSGSANSRVGFIGDTAKIVPCMGRPRSSMAGAVNGVIVPLTCAANGTVKKFHSQLRLEAFFRIIFEKFQSDLFHY
jgi:hypothetical protein